MEVGKVYLLRGGLILRYQGPYARTPTRRDPSTAGPCLAFRRLTQGVMEPAVGYSATEEDVIQEVTANDLPWIRRRREECLIRDLFTEVEDMDHLIAELEKSSN